VQVTVAGVFAQLLKFAIPPTVPFRFTRQNPLHLVLGEKTLGLVSDQGATTHQALDLRLTPDEVLVQCKALRFKQAAAWLEFPWVQVGFETIAQPSHEEAYHYAQAQLSRLTKLPDSAPIGLQFFESGEHDRIGLFYARPSSATLQLVQAFRQQFRVQLQVVPLVAGWFHLLPDEPSKLLLSGLEQSCFVEQQKGVFLQICELPQLPQAAATTWAADHFGTRNDSITHTRLSLETEASGTPSTASDTLEMQTLLQAWPGFAKHPSRGFLWMNRVQKPFPWVEAGLSLLLLAVLAWGVGLWRDSEQQLQSLHTELASQNQFLQARLQEQEAWQALQQQQAQVQKLQNLWDETYVRPAMSFHQVELWLQLVRGAWVAQFSYQPAGMELTLLTLNPKALRTIRARFAQRPEVQSATLLALEQVELRGTPVRQGTLRVTLNPKNALKP
jgi:hypothetical protein